MDRQLRNLNRKKFKEALFLFEVDNKTDICSTRKIIDPEEQIFEGSCVSVKYGDDVFRAKIIKLSGMFKTIINILYLVLEIAQYKRDDKIKLD